MAMGVLTIMSRASRNARVSHGPSCRGSPIPSVADLADLPITGLTAQATFGSRERKAGMLALSSGA
jgi:hypothetical protein